MLKLTFKLLIIAALILAGIIYANYLKTGRFSLPAFFSRPEISVPTIKVPTLSKWPDKGSKVAYKWRDQSGSWQYTSEPPKDGVHYEEIEALPATELE